jgi:hypothetical protein
VRGFLECTLIPDFLNEVGLSPGAYEISYGAFATTHMISYLYSNARGEGSWRNVGVDSSPLFFLKHLCFNTPLIIP